jgi:lipoprotein-anchoring transpeptidase ErfK/SrfK
MMFARSICLALYVGAAFAGIMSGASAAVLINVDKSAQRMTVAVDGAVRWVWPVSTGMRRYDTPSGRYTAFRMEKDHFSKEWDDAPMPHSIFFTPRGHAIHGSYHTRLGRPASHGCVRLSPANAAKLYALVEREGVSNATVIVSGSVQRVHRRDEIRARPIAAAQ